MSAIGLSLRVVGAGQASHGLKAQAARSNTALTRNLLLATKETENQVKRRMTGPKLKDPFWGVMGSQDPYSLAVRSGLTRAATSSSRSVLRDSAGNPYTFVVNTAKHMAILEEGGTIHGHPWLRIPTKAAQTPSGVDRLAGASARSLPGGFIWPNRSQKGKVAAKNLWVATADRGKLTLWYMLTKEVTIKPHRIFQNAANDMAPRIAELCGNKVAAEVVLGHE